MTNGYELGYWALISKMPGCCTTQAGFQTSVKNP